MMSVLRVSSEAIDLDALMRLLPGLHPDATWRAGEPHGRRDRATTNGFNVTLASGSDWKQLLDRALKSLEALQPLLGAARTANVKVELDFSLEVGGNQFLTRTASFSPAQMKQLFDLGVTVLVSAYPVSDGEQG